MALQRSENALYDPEKKIWKHRQYPHSKFIQQSVGDVFLQTMRSIEPNKVLEYYFDSNEEKTAQEIHKEAVTVALNLRRLGIRKGDVVALYMLNNPQVASLAMGSYLIGAIVNYFDTKLIDDHIDYIFQMVQPTVILYETEYSKAVLNSIERIQLKSPKLCLLLADNSPKPNVHSVLYQPIRTEDMQNFVSCPIADPQNDICSLVMTSGSTGIPKLAQISHSLMLEGLRTWWWEQLNEDAVLFTFSPLRWISQVGLLLQSLLFGVKRVCVTGAPIGRYGAEVIRKVKITHMFSAPGIYADILSAVDDNDYTSLASMRCLMLGGEPPSQEVIQTARKKSPQSKVYSCYGMTEAAGCICQDEHINGGYLVDGVQMRILDDERKPLGPLECGKYAFRTVAPFTGYLHVDRKKDFLEDGFFVNGDYGYFEDSGRLVFLARYKDLIKSNNVTLIPDSVERMISEIPEVTVARLVGYKTTSTDEHIGALFVISKAGKDKEDGVRHRIRFVLENNLEAHESAIVRDIHFVEAMPLTTCGKLDRVALRALAAQCQAIDMGSKK